MTDPSTETPIPVLTGPTGAGKTAASLAIAERHGLEIVSMDSMTVYRGMDVGTAKPTTEERARAPHHLIDVVDPDETYDTARWCAAAGELVDLARANGRRLMFVGGTPLYLMAFFKGLVEGVPANLELRKKLESQDAEEPGRLHRRLREVDPTAASRIHPNDLRRTVRALEVYETTGRPLSEQQDTFDSEDWRIPCSIVVFDWPTEVLRSRIKQRTEAMLTGGLVEETRAIRDSGGFSTTAAAAIGYAECLQHLERPFKDEDELRNRIRRSTHGLVKRQRNWLRRLEHATRLQPDADLAEVERGLGLV